MIGGVDLILPSIPRSIYHPRIILGVIADRWPEALLENADDGPPRPLTAVLGDHAEAVNSEFFVYRDEASASSWQEHGATGSNANQMVHFLVADDPQSRENVRVTMVVDSTDRTMRDLHDAIVMRFQHLLASETRGMADTP